MSFTKLAWHLGEHARTWTSQMIGSKKRVRSNHASYHIVFTKAAYRNFWSSKMPWTCSIVERHKTGCLDQKVQC